jgi:hypothetical protein
VELSRKLGSVGGRHSTINPTVISDQGKLEWKQLRSDRGSVIFGCVGRPIAITC